MPGLMELQVKVVSALVNKGVSLSTSMRACGGGYK